MGTRENKVEKYLDEQIKSLGGITRKWVSPGHDGVPDRIAIIGAVVFFPEVKTSDGELSVIQRREHDRLRNHGAMVCIVYGHDGVDKLMKDLLLYNRPMVRFYG